MELVVIRGESVTSGIIFIITPESTPDPRREKVQVTTERHIVAISFTGGEHYRRNRHLIDLLQSNGEGSDKDGYAHTE